MAWLLWALLSAFFAGATAILAKIGVAEIDSNLATAVRTSVILLFTWCIAFGTGGAGAVFSLNARSWLFLVCSGVATGLSWLCYFRALQLGPVAKVAPIDKLSVVIAILLSGIFLHERVGFREILGGGLIVLGAIVLAWI